MLYPQNGDRIVTIDSVTSLYPMYSSVNPMEIRRHYVLGLSVRLCVSAVNCRRFLALTRPRLQRRQQFCTTQSPFGQFCPCALVNEAYNTLCHEKYGEEITKIVPMKRRVFKNLLLRFQSTQYRCNCAIN